MPLSCKAPWSELTCVQPFFCLRTTIIVGVGWLRERLYSRSLRLDCARVENRSRVEFGKTWSWKGARQQYTRLGNISVLECFLP